MGKFRVSLLAFALVLSACHPAKQKQGHSKSDEQPPPSNSKLTFCSEGQCLSPITLTWRLRDRIERLKNAARTTPQLRPMLAQYTDRLQGDNRRTARADQLITRLNQNAGCKLIRYSEGEQMTFARELSHPDCNLLQRADFAPVADDFKALAEMALPEEAVELRAQGEAFASLGREVLALVALEDGLFAHGVLRWEDGHLRAQHIGHPFESENLTAELETYMKSAQALGRHWGELTGVEAVPCPEPACRLAIYHVAEAVSLRPQMDQSRLDSYVAPSAYGLSYFSQRFAGSREVRLALGLNMQPSWVWRPEQLQSTLAPTENVLIFQQLMRDVGMRFSLANWQERNEYPLVVPLFLTFQEAQGVLDYLHQLPQQAIVAQIREIRFEPYASVMVDFTPTGAGWRLNLHVLRAAQELGSIEAARQRLYDQLAISFAQVQLTQ